MIEYSELVKALRCKRDDCEGCDLAFFDKDEGWMCQYAAKDDDAADVIESLQAKIERLTKENKELAADRPEMEEVNGHWEWRKPNGEQLIPKRGEWKCSYPEIEPNPMFMYGICSICGFEQSISNKLNYCPNCGAKMEV